VAPIITGIIVHFGLHIRCISIHKLLYFNLLLLLLLLLPTFLTSRQFSRFSKPYRSHRLSTTYSPSSQIYLTVRHVLRRSILLVLSSLEYIYSRAEIRTFQSFM
jgi:hypothetical protein